MKLNDDFSNIEEFETTLKNKGIFNLWLMFQSEGEDGFYYEDLTKWQDKFLPFGLTFDFGLDTETFDFEIN